MRPLIGITPEVFQTPTRRDGRGAFCGVSYSQAIEAAGGTPLVLPLTKDRRVLDDLLSRCDGLMLTGGGDLGHKYYAPRMPAKLRQEIHGFDEVRDEMELYVVRKAYKADLPLLGICRGIQVMNVALGGTLLVDVLGHRNAQPDALCQPLVWEPTSQIHAVLGRDASRVNTSHHQALDKLGQSLRITARAEDGVIEAVEHPSKRLFWGVQFHPERLVKVAPQFLKLFRALVGAARQA